MNVFSVLAKEHTASIRDIQKNPSRVLRGVTRVLRGGRTVGFFLANEEFAELVEDHEALSSKALKARITKARHVKKTRGSSLTKIAGEYGL